MPILICLPRPFLLSSSWLLPTRSYASLSRMYVYVVLVVSENLLVSKGIFNIADFELAGEIGRGHLKYFYSLMHQKLVSINTKVFHQTTAKPKKFQGRNELNQWYQIDRQKEEKEQVDSASVYYTEGYIEIEREGCLGRRRYGKSRELGEDMVRAESLE
ncbi:hypothetical protein Bca101_078963 [Brassica carinata]